MSLNDQGATPGVTMTSRPAAQGGRNIAVLHLTKNSQAIVAGNRTQGSGAGALEFAASVDATMQKGDNPSDWEFSFIQYLKQPTQKFYYAGFAKSDGGMALNATDARP